MWWCGWLWLYYMMAEQHPARCVVQCVGLIHTWHGETPPLSNHKFVGIFLARQSSIMLVSRRCAVWQHTPYTSLWLCTTYCIVLGLTHDRAGRTLCEPYQVVGHHGVGVGTWSGQGDSLVACEHTLCRVGRTTTASDAGAVRAVRATVPMAEAPATHA